MFADPLLQAEENVHEAEKAVNAATTPTARALARIKLSKTVNRLDSAKYDADPEGYRLRDEASRDAAAQHAYLHS